MRPYVLRPGYKIPESTARFIEGGAYPGLKSTNRQLL